MNLTQDIYALIKACSTELPEDIIKAIRHAESIEKRESASQIFLNGILDNIELSKQNGTPLCQDTGAPYFLVKAPNIVIANDLKDSIRAAVVKATQDSILRPNTVDSISGRNKGNNIGEFFPIIKIEQWDKDEFEFKFMLKGGGCENVSSQYSLPSSELNAGRDLEGVRRCVIDAVVKAQGKGCAPGVIGVCIGGYRDTGYEIAKSQLFRKLDDKNPHPELEKLERRLIAELNALGIGAMGVGGKTTVLGVKIASSERIPASFFVSISYMCWACRRKTMTCKDGRCSIC